MNYLISLYGKVLDWLEPYEQQIGWFALGVISVTILLLILNAQWLLAAIYAGLTYANFRINLINEKSN